MDFEDVVAHRPFAKPRGPWVLYQSWRTLLFAHWPVPCARLRPLVPPALDLEECRGSAWIGLVPFRIARMHARLLPPLPGLSGFPEMNLRTYVRVRDQPGIFFFSLDAASTPAVVAARLAYGLPYFRADMAVEEEGGWTRYRSHRRGGREAEFEARYRPAGAAFTAAPGSLEHFLTERYVLYTVAANGLVLRGDIHHLPWPLQPAEAEIRTNTVAPAHGISLPPTPPLLHYSHQQDALIWPPAIARRSA